MTEPQPNTCKKRRLWRALLLSVPVLVGCFVFSVFGPNPRLRVSEETTHIVSPLGADGLPDYGKFILSRMPSDVPPDENAAVLYWEATWPGELATEDQRNAVCDALGMSVPMYAGIDDVFINASSEMRIWIRRTYSEQLAVAADTETESSDPSRWARVDAIANELCDKAISTPWTSAEIPPLADWLRINRRKLDLLVSGSARKSYFNPPPNMVDGSEDNFAELQIPGVNIMRSASNALGMRAMLHLGEGRIDDAWIDLKARHQMARHVSNGFCLVEALIASALERAASDGTQTLLHHGKLTASQIRQIQSELDALEDLESLAEVIGLGERFMFLECITNCSMGESRMANFRPIFGSHHPSESGAEQTLDSVRIDWNEIARQGNQWFDLLVEAHELPPTQRMAKLDQIHAKVHAIDEAVEVKNMLTIKSRTKIMANQAVLLLLPSIGAQKRYIRQNETSANMTRIVFSLAHHRAEHGIYPMSLDELVPSAIEKLPMDVYSDHPYRYKRTADGFCLYSVGEDGVDNGGTGNGVYKMEPTDEDISDKDVVVWMPKTPLGN